MRRHHSRFRLCLIITLLTIAIGLLSISVSLPPTNLISTISAQEKGGVVLPKPRSTPRPPIQTPSPSTSRRTTKPTRQRQTAPQIEMVLIPAGTFMMGSPDGIGKSAEHPQYWVTLQSFYIGKYEVTQAQYRAVMGTNPSNFKGDNLPVEQVSWNEAKEFCRRLSWMTGREYRLPSEAEWEYACRAGTTGDYAGNLDSMAWYSRNAGEKTHPVGQKQANGFGLYDMHGNVWEWCEDWYHESYNGAPSDGSAWVSGGGQLRVQRGGSWANNAYGLRSAGRYWYVPNSRPSVFDGGGFRVVADAR